MKFCEKLQRLRKEKGLSQEQLADMLDVSRQSVSKWESGSTYPEMDKLIMLCKIFNVTLDDFTNDDVTDQTIKEKNKSTFNGVLYLFLDMISKTVDMFKNMNKKDLSKCITEMLIVFILLMFCSIPFNYVDNLVRNIFINFGDKTFSILFSIWTFLSSVIYLVLFVLIFVYIFKTRYLDKFELSENKEVLKEMTNSKEENEKQIVVTEKRGSGFLLFDVIGKIFNFFVKFCLFFVAIPMIFVFFAFVFLGVVAFILLFKGVFYPGVFIGLLGCIILSYVIMKICISFLFDLKLHLARLFGVFIGGIVICSVGGALMGFELAEMQFINEVPSEFNKSVQNYTIPFNDKMYLSNFYFHYGWNLSYEIDDNLTDQVQISVFLYDRFIDVKMEEKNGEIYFVTNDVSMGIKEITDVLLDNLRMKTLYDYSKLYQSDIIIKSSYQNIEKIKNNTSEKLREFETNEKLKMYERYEKRIDELERENEDLRDYIDEADEKILDLEEKFREIKDVMP